MRVFHQVPQGLFVNCAYPQDSNLAGSEISLQLLSSMKQSIPHWDPLACRNHLVIGHFFFLRGAMLTWQCEDMDSWTYWFPLLGC